MHFCAICKQASNAFFQVHQLEKLLIVVESQLKDSQDASQRRIDEMKASLEGSLTRGDRLEQKTSELLVQNTTLQVSH